MDKSVILYNSFSSCPGDLENEIALLEFAVNKCDAFRIKRW